MGGKGDPPVAPAIRDERNTCGRPVGACWCKDEVWAFDRYGRPAGRPYNYYQKKMFCAGRAGRVICFYTITEKSGEKAGKG
jgi:hypothetical protein